MLHTHRKIIYTCILILELTQQTHTCAQIIIQNIAYIRDDNININKTVQKSKTLQVIVKDRKEDVCISIVYPVIYEQSQ